MERTQVIRFNMENTKRLRDVMGQYDDIQEIIGKLFDAYDEKRGMKRSVDGKGVSI